jgi:glycerophosphoryl diester phosphodiesterase
MNQNLEKLIIAHRGESFIAPENTLAAINLAWENGAKAVEIDVQITLDKEIVVIHDKNTKRVGDLNKSINQSKLKDLKKVDVGLFKNENWKGEQIPTLGEVLNTIPSDGKLIIEIKSGVEIVAPLNTLINSSNIPESQIEIISFNRKVLTEIKKLLPQHKMLWLLDLDYYLPTWLLFSNTQKTIRLVLNSKLDGVNVWAGKKINEDFVNQFKQHNLLVYTWTVNDLKTAKDMIKMRVDALTTDRAAWLKKQLMDDNLQ